MITYDITDELIERFHQKYYINANTGCWEWTATKDPDGYGTIAIRPNCRTKWSTARALRVSYRIFNGDIPEGLIITHTCNNPSCVNPEHLILGTHKTNYQDALAAGKISCGSRHYKARIDEQTALYIKTSPLRNCELMRELGLPKHIISYIKRGICWKHVKA